MGLAREHWKIESIHWFLDVNFPEDDCRFLSENAKQATEFERKVQAGEVVSLYDLTD